MNKKLLGAALIIGIIILPSTVFAWSEAQITQPFKVIDCSVNNGSVSQCSQIVNKFQDGSINCYVASQYSDQDVHDPAISCVRNR